MDKRTICKIFREILLDYGKDALKGAILLTPYEGVEYVSDIKCLYAPTIGSEKLANVRYNVAKYFEDRSC